MSQHVDTKIPQVRGGTMMVLPAQVKTISFQVKPITLLLYEFYYNENNPPNFVWLSNDKHFFASVSDWFSTIRSGYESLVDSLNILQLIQSKDYFVKQMKSLADSLPAQLAIAHVRVFDSEHASMQDDMTVIVSNGKIISIGKTSSTKIPKGYKTIDGVNPTLMPGLWDMHAHFEQAEWGPAYLAAGVTTVRDCGNEFDYINAIKNSIDQGSGIGPNIIKAGIIDGKGLFGTT
jgi:hypothetical protein